MMTRRYIPLCLLLLLVCCNKPDPAPSEEVPVMISLDTKAFPDPGEHTYRVGLFDGATKAFLAQGTYCSDYVDHSATSGKWLSPCNVDNASGNPLKTDGTAAASLAEADKDRSYGLRYYSNARAGTYAYLVAMSPAKSFSSAGSLRYYAWNPNDAVYVSNGVFSMFTASWFNNQFIYQASTSSDMHLKDRRSSVDIHIECGELPVANIQKVILKNCVRKARWYLPDGFLASDTNYGTPEDVVVRNFATPLELVKAHSDEWSSATDTDATTVYLPSIDWSDLGFAALRPQIEIWLGSDPAKHFTAKVDITEAMEPMMHYTYNLVVSKSTVNITLTAEPWDTPSSAQSERNTAAETPAVIRTVTIEGWDPVTDTADDWATTI